MAAHELIVVLDGLGKHLEELGGARGVRRFAAQARQRQVPRCATGESRAPDQRRASWNPRKSERNQLLPRRTTSRGRVQ
jgi:hypothetical protein